MTSSIRKKTSMSVLGRKEVSRRVRDENLVENLSERELNNPEGVGIDLRLGAVYRIKEGGAYINADTQDGLGRRKGVTAEQIADGNSESSPTKIVIEPGDYFLVQTMETINTPDDLMPAVYPRSSLYRAGLNLIASKADPGYEGKFTFGLSNLSGFPVVLEMGARICNVVFFKVEGGSVAYRGQHQGGRVTSDKEEQQV